MNLEDKYLDWIARDQINQEILSSPLSPIHPHLNKPYEFLVHFISATINNKLCEFKIQLIILLNNNAIRNVVDFTSFIPWIWKNKWFSVNFWVKISRSEKSCLYVKFFAPLPPIIKNLYMGGGGVIPRNIHPWWPLKMFSNLLYPEEDH